MSLGREKFLRHLSYLSRIWCREGFPCAPLVSWTVPAGSVGLWVQRPVTWSDREPAQSHKGRTCKQLSSDQLVGWGKTLRPVVKLGALETKVSQRNTSATSCETGSRTNRIPQRVSSATSCEGSPSKAGPVSRLSPRAPYGRTPQGAPVRSLSAGPGGFWLGGCYLLILLVEDLPFQIYWSCVDHTHCATVNPSVVTGEILPRRQDQQSVH